MYIYSKVVTEPINTNLQLFPTIIFEENRGINWKFTHIPFTRVCMSRTAVVISQMFALCESVCRERNTFYIRVDLYTHMQAHTFTKITN